MLKLIRLSKSFIYAFRGLIKVFQEEQNFQIQSIIGILVIIVGLIVKLSLLEWAMILVAIFLVLLMEVINSATERVADVLKPRIDSHVKEIKDIMAAAVILASLLAIIIGALVFTPHLIG